MTFQVCVDASFVLKLLLDEPESQTVNALWAEWLAGGVDVCAPYHLAFEVVSVIRNHVYRGNISAEAGRLAFEAFLAQDIQMIPPEPLYQRAWELAEQLGRPTVYDTFYVAAAEFVDCDLWTYDKTLYRAAHEVLPLIKMP